MTDIEPFIEVRTDAPLQARDRGREWRFPGGVERVRLPVDVYRRLRTRHEFRRSLQRVRGFGREYWVDLVWRSHLAYLRKPILKTEDAPPVPRKPCGCGKKKLRAIAGASAAKFDGTVEDARRLLGMEAGK